MDDKQLIKDLNSVLPTLLRYLPINAGIII